MYIASNVMNMVISSLTAQTGNHHQAHLHIVTDSIPAPDAAPDQLLDATTGTDMGTADQGSQSQPHRYRSHTHHDFH